MYVISRNNLLNNDEFWSSDNTRNWFQQKKDPTFDMNFVKKFHTFAQAIDELSSVIKPNYLTNFEYGVKTMNEKTLASFEDTPCWVLRKTTIKTGKAEYLSSDTSIAYFDESLSGNFTRKYYSMREAQEAKQRYTAQSIASVYKFDIVEFNSAAKDWNKKQGDGGNYEGKMGNTGVGLK